MSSRTGERVPLSSVRITPTIIYASSKTIDNIRCLIQNVIKGPGKDDSAKCTFDRKEKLGVDMRNVFVSFTLDIPVAKLVREVLRSQERVGGRYVDNPAESQ